MARIATEWNNSEGFDCHCRMSEASLQIKWLEQGDQALVVEYPAVHQAKCHLPASLVLVKATQGEGIQQAGDATGGGHGFPQGDQVQACPLLACQGRVVHPQARHAHHAGTATRNRRDAG